MTITVQGSRAPEGELAAEPFAATSRARRELLAAPALRAPELLRGEAGVQVSEAGGLGAPATASIRGATAAQTPVYLGGVRLNDQVGGVADLSAIPIWLVDHVDVYRGNAPFDANEPGIAGAIFFEPRRPRKTEAAAGMTAGSFGSRSGFGYAALGDDHLGVLAGLSAERADNDYAYDDDRGTAFDPDDDARAVRSNSDSRLTDGWLLARARPSERARLEFLGNHVSREQGAPKLALVPSLYARARLERNLAALSARLGLDATGERLLTLRTSWLDTSTHLDDPGRELGGLSRTTSVRGRRAEQQATLEFPLSARLTAGLAGSGAYESLERRDDAQPSTAQASTLRGAARLSWLPGSATTLFAQAAAQCRATQPGSAGCADLEPTGRLGAGFRAQRFTAFANLSRYQRLPALGELYGAGIVVRGNSRLRPEVGVAADAGARGDVRLNDQWSLRGSVSGFVRQSHDLIAYARAAQGYVVPINVGEARVAGLELSLGADALRHVSMDCNVSLLDPRNTTEGRRLVNDILPYMSRLVVAPRLLLTTGLLAGRALKSADVGLDVTYLSSRYADAAGLIVIPEQTTANLSASASWWSGAFVTRARVVNLLDTERFDIVGYPLPGRSFYVSAEVRAE